MPSPRYPSLYQINTRVWLTELAQARGRRATLDDIADAELDRVARMGFDWVWLLSVWRTGAAGQTRLPERPAVVSDGADGANPRDDDAVGQGRSPGRRMLSSAP